MRRFTYILSFLTVALFVLAVASTANADGVDPKIIIQDAASVGTTLIPGTTFSFFTTGSDCNFTSPAGTPGDCFIKNTGTATWTAISLDISPSQAGPFTCSALPFFTDPCNVVADGDGDLVAIFSGGPGVAVGQELFISLSQWANPTTFDATITTAPEPGSLALLLTGGGFFLARRRRQNVSHA